MKISYNWLIELTGLDWSVDEMAERLTNCGTACEDIQAVGRFMDNVVVGEVVELKPIEGADKIRLATVNLGSETKELVCGAPNVAVGQKVPVALVGARLAGDMVIRKAKIRGIESSGMICSERELGISDDHSGIMVLDSDAPIGTPLKEYLAYDDYRLTFELTPNRPDSMSAIGIARDAAALASVKVRKPKISLIEVEEKALDIISVAIEDSDACPRYAARVIKNVKIGPSPWWIKRKLLISGIRPINNVVDITNYVLLETGHPLHAFDLDRFGSRKVVVRRARDKEMFTTLDGKEHELIPDVLLITNGNTGVAAAGVMGGLDSEVEDTTTNILLESAYFNPSVIRKSRKHLGFVTESSTRFEKGADPNGVLYAMDRAAALMAELCGGEVLAGVVDCYPKPIEPKTIDLRPQRCNDILGTSLSVERMAQILSNLEFEVKTEEKLSVTVPTFRPDIEREIDLIEEVVRIEGFFNVPDAITNIGPLFTPIHPEDKFVEEMRTLLTGAGFDEVLSHGLANSKLVKKINPDLPAVHLLNTATAELDVMRNSMMSSMLTIISHNVAHRNIDLKLFEIGKVYFPPSASEDWKEEGRVALAVTGKTPNTWRETPRLFDFYDLTGALELVRSHFRWGSWSFEAAELPGFDKSLSYIVKLDNTPIGSIGQVASGITDFLDIKQPVLIVEFSIEELAGISTRQIEFTPLPQYPAAPRDIAMMLDLSVPVGEVIDAVKETAGELAESVDLFDVYTGKQIESGKKSIAISISYRSSKGSLSSEEVDAVQQKVIGMLKEKFNAVIRDK